MFGFNDFKVRRKSPSVKGFPTRSTMTTVDRPTSNLRIISRESATSSAPRGRSSLPPRPHRGRSPDGHGRLPDGTGHPRPRLVARSPVHDWLAILGEQLELGDLGCPPLAVVKDDGRCDRSLRPMPL